MSQKKKVVITGLDIISSLGLNIETNWENLVNGKSGTKKIVSFDPSQCTTQFAAELPDGFEEYADKKILRRLKKKMTRVTKMSYLCSKQAIEASKVNFDDYDKTRCAVIFGIVSNNYSEKERQKTADHRIIKAMANAPSAWISLEYGLEGPSYSVATACASSAYAIGAGYDLIADNKSDVVVVGGTDSHIEPEKIDSFNKLYALSVRNNSPETASRPFTKTRDGFVMGEGAGCMVLESEESALKRGAKIYAAVSGYATTSEAFNIVAPKKDGIGMAKTMELAIQNSELSKDDFDYINAHGTSTYFNDKYETMAIKNVFGKRSSDLLVSSSKSMHGHTIGAAGVIEGIITAMTIHTSTVTPTINYIDPDPELDLNYVPNHSVNKKINTALSNSFGFGGHNASIVFTHI